MLSPGNLDLSIVNYHNSFLDKLNIFESEPAFISWQESLKASNGSGHMQFILRKTDT